jgi:glycosyltransferase involved in cell wall biosynthesis
MAHGKPIVASRIGGIPELVRDRVTGLLFEPKDTRQLSDCIRLLLGDSDLRTKLGRQARQIAETEHSRDRHGATLLSLYESLTADKKSQNKSGL